MRKKTAALAVILLFLTVTLWGVTTAGAEPPVETPAENVILMVPDGTGIAHTTLARWYKGDPLALDEIAAGLVKTYSAESAVTDSAPAATAFATGFKSNDEYVSVLPDKTTTPGVKPAAADQQFKPVASVLEGAKMLGKATGLIATKMIEDATPAAFSAHTPDRRDSDSVAEQQVYQQIDVVLGGGLDYLLPENAGGKRKDGQNMVHVLENFGYDVVKTSEEMKNSSAAKLWGAFTPKHMSYDIDRIPTEEPSLAEMTDKAIDVLSQDPEGFFLLVEGSQIDMASHANDPVGVISETLAFDKAVNIALEFAKQNPDTLLIVAADHGNGGLSIGNRNTDSNYDKLDISSYLQPLKMAKLTGAGLESKLNTGKTNVKEVLREYYGINDLTEEEIAAIKNAPSGDLNEVVGPMISKRANLGWTTSGHTGEDTVLYAFGPESPAGVLDNTEIARTITQALGLDLKELNESLFVPAKNTFESLGAKVYYDQADPENPVLEVIKGDNELKLPVNTSIANINGNIKYMEGLTLAPKDIIYVPREAVEIFQAEH
ncbi:MAG: alkaline phosphatase [Firmicutes bacterium]|nr:alkaline phosphatase [Bacillota bacterium]